jgi:hypothetical protein
MRPTGFVLPECLSLTVVLTADSIDCGFSGRRTAGIPKSAPYRRSAPGKIEKIGAKYGNEHFERGSTHIQFRATRILTYRETRTDVKLSPRLQLYVPRSRSDREKRSDPRCQRFRN